MAFLHYAVCHLNSTQTKRVTDSETACLALRVHKNTGHGVIADACAIQYKQLAMLHCGKKLWRTFKPTAKHGALTTRSRPYLTFVPSPTGYGMKNSPRRGAGRNRHFSRDFDFGESKITANIQERKHILPYRGLDTYKAAKGCG
ncbi:hypothetical protein ROHU_006065 [Labeo rohita]|uniref:Uncharacterized protein n=1 Tax=Labeo rohita TaxID=84645 RepID=A0A498N7H8_LABRO|nr:hypothetical protein ROHU_006065 [Labeo rohita]